MKAFIVEDELINIKILKNLLQKYCPTLEVIGNAQNIDDAHQFLLYNTIELLFLDIELPGKNGFELLKLLGSQINFHIIFVTAFSSYAMQAIKFSAMDYLLKPVQAKELVDAVKKVESTIAEKSKIELLLKNLQVNQDDLTIAIPQWNETRFVKVNQIIKCESENNYTTLTLTTGENILVSKGIFEYDALLTPLHFIRCHRSYLINKAYVKKLIRRKNEWTIIMTDGSKIPVARSKKLKIQMEFDNLI